MRIECEIISLNIVLYRWKVCYFTRCKTHLGSNLISQERVLYLYNCEVAFHCSIYNISFMFMANVRAIMSLGSFAALWIDVFLLLLLQDVLLKINTLSIRSLFAFLNFQSISKLLHFLVFFFIWVHCLVFTGIKNYHVLMLTQVERSSSHMKLAYCKFVLSRDANR